MSHLLALIDDYKDRHGQPSDASIARAIGVKPQTISSWRTRGLKDMPRHGTLKRLAAFIGKDYETVVLWAALEDASYVEPLSDPPPNPDRKVKGA